VTSQRIPALGRRIAMTCSFHLDPDIWAASIAACDARRTLRAPPS
jgi:hypothetical protein